MSAPCPVRGDTSPRSPAKDWRGNSKSKFVTLGASNHSATERQQHDFYATDPAAVRQLLERETFAPQILEPCCGAGHIARALAEAGYIVQPQDLYDYGYAPSGIDFLAYKPTPPCLLRPASTSSPTRRIPSRRSLRFTRSKSCRSTTASPSSSGFNSSNRQTAICGSGGSARWRKSTSPRNAPIAP